MGPITFEVNLVGYNHLSSSVKLDAIQGEFVSHGRKFGFTGDISIKCDVVLHQDFEKKRPADIRQPVGTPVKEQAHSRVAPMLKTVAVAGVFVVGVVLVIKASPLILAAAGTAACASMIAGARRNTGVHGLPHILDPNDPRLTGGGA